MVGMRNSPQEVSSYLRKVRKPMVEKQRRERMNQSIDQLKLLIADTIKQHMAPMTRVDKADILELTVFHLTRLQQQQRSVSMSTDVSNAAYDAGFKDCAREAVNHVTSTAANKSSRTDGTISGKLSDHLRSVYLNKSRGRAVPITTRNDRHSTPLHVRAADNFVNVGDVRQQFTAPEYSPITPVTGSSFRANVHQESSVLNFNGYGGASIHDSDSGYSTSSFSASTDCTSVTTDIYSETRDVINVVTIGEGKENEIGHVITETVWRPW